MSKSSASDSAIVWSQKEFGILKTRLIQTDFELRRLLALPLIYATVLTTDPRQTTDNADVKVTILHDGQIFEVHASPSMTLKPGDNVKVDLATRKICD
ncbi:MAG TPA: hypothetical protein DDZ51_05470 [Planctomycetaceae bacterium]|nr:hypothetical protein [Planctomycetaceae bacterium]